MAPKLGRLGPKVMEIYHRSRPDKSPEAAPSSQLDQPEQQQREPKEQTQLTPQEETEHGWKVVEESIRDLASACDFTLVETLDRDGVLKTLDALLSSQDCDKAASVRDKVCKFITLVKTFGKVVADAVAPVGFSVNPAAWAQLTLPGILPGVSVLQCRPDPVGRGQGVQ